jgi:hypothetical protein
MVGCRGKDEPRIDLGLTTLLVIATPASAPDAPLRTVLLPSGPVSSLSGYHTFD